MSHPHPNRRHVMQVYRGHILGSKRKWGSARGLIHYKRLIGEYLAAKRDVITLSQRKKGNSMKHGISPTTDSRPHSGRLIWASEHQGTFRRDQKAARPHRSGALRAAYAKWCEQALTLWASPPLSYRQWCHPFMRAPFQAAMDGAFV